MEQGLDLTVGATPPEVVARDFPLPAPALAVRAGFRLWRQLYLATEINGICLGVFGFEGALIDGGVAAEYRAWKYLTLGVACNGMWVNVRARPDTDYPGAAGFGSVNVDFQGPMVFIKLTF